MEEKAELPSLPKDEKALDARATGLELAADVIAGRKSVMDVRSFLQTIKHPGVRLKVQYEFRQQLWSKVGPSLGVDNWTNYVKSLKNLQSQFIPD